MSTLTDELARLGAATVYEASGREGLVDADLIPIVPGARACGPARIARCAQDDNLMVHAAMAALQPGEILVLTMPEPAPVALLGDLLATQALVRGGAVRLLGARCILTGISENVAMTLVALGVSFEELNPMRSLKQALEYCISQRAGAARKKK